MYGRVFGVGEFKYAICIFKGAKGVAMATKFGQELAKIALILVLYKISKIFRANKRVTGVGEFTYAI